MKKNKKKKTINIKLIILFLVIVLLGFFFTNRKDFYKIEDRVDNITKEKKKDAKNITTIGWIRVQGTNIDYPIIAYGKQFDYFTDLEGKKSFAYNVEEKEELFNKVNLLGHNIMNLSKNPGTKNPRYAKFEALMAFVYLDFAKKNKYIQYTINGENYLYKIYAVRLYSSYDRVETEIEKTYTEKEIEKYAKEVKKDSLYKYKVDIDGKDNLISLITCTRFYGAENDAAFVVDARMVRKGEKIRNYPVKETDNYKEILKMMKGDGKNEV